MSSDTQSRAEDDRSHCPGRTLRPGEFLGSRRLLRSQAGWHAYYAAYPSSSRYGMHDHERAALCMVVAGEYRETASGRTIDVRAGSIVQQPAGNHHADEHGDQQVELLIIEFEPDYMARTECTASVLSERVFRSDAATKKIVAALGRELDASDAAAPLACEALILDALVQLSRATTTRHDDCPTWLRRIDDRIRTFTMPPPSLAELAMEAGRHPSHLARAFRKHRGVSLGEYRRRLMIDEALRQIEHTHLSLADIAAATGFADQSHMTRLFATHLGRTPAKYRQFKSL